MIGACAEPGLPLQVWSSGPANTMAVVPTLLRQTDRGGTEAVARLRETSLYRPDLDLLVQRRGLARRVLTTGVEAVKETVVFSGRTRLPDGGSGTS